MKTVKNKARPWLIPVFIAACLLLAILLPQSEPTDIPDPTTVPTNTWLPTETITREHSATQPPQPLQATETQPADAAALYPCIPFENGSETGVVTGIVDGDTIYVTLGGKEYSVRYIGIDAPEMNSGDLLAEQAKAFNSSLVEGKTVELVRDVSETDIYDRLLRYVLVDSTFVNYELVSTGLANAKMYPPDTSCHEFFEQAQSTAISSRGNTVPLPLPSPTAGAESPSCPTGCSTELPGCSIKGNISMDGEKIYHLPGMRDYSKTVINPDKGERWFCTEDEAKANGWRRALR
jgi:micrococcal nuclease